MTKFSLIGAVLLVVLCTGGCGGGDEEADHPARYQITINNGWPQIEDEKEVAGFLESAWLDPVGPIIAINTRLADETGSPMANAQLARIQTSKLPDYRERVFKKIRLGGRPTVKWGFDISKDESRMEFFFEECDTAFIVRGSMGTIGYEAFTGSFSDMTSTLKADCDE